MQRRLNLPCASLSPNHLTTIRLARLRQRPASRSRLRKADHNTRWQSDNVK